MNELIFLFNSFFNLNASEIFVPANLFLIGIALLWTLIAVIQDFRKREVANWWNFSLIAFVLVFRAFVALNTRDVWYLYWGLIGLAVGFVLANLFYYARMFAGGDAKLLMALGTVIPLSNSFLSNLHLFARFILLFIILGSLYGLVYSLVLIILNFGEFRKAFSNYYLQYRLLSWIAIVVAFVFGIFFSFIGFYMGVVLSIVVLLLPFLLISAKAIEDSCLSKKIAVRDLTIGDWLSEDVKAGGRVIKPNWEGLDERELALIQKKLKNKKVAVKYGIPFTPSFLLGLLALVFLIKLL